ncbi:MAG: TonB-dependent receptor plug domain-containing protein, partial [Pseudomonadota bacterium]
MKLKTIARCIALIGISTGTSAWVQAQELPAPPPQKVEITGSSIKRIASEGALPIEVITRKQLEAAGIVTAEQFIANLNINGNGSDNLASNADVTSGAQRGNNGASSANLRGQGADSTLVLLNGRRVATHGMKGSAVDLNSIPMAAVERIEVLKDGASAIYGTDAIGGVINFILRKNYNGLEAQAFTDISQQGGGNIKRVSVVGGFGDLDKDNYNVLLTATHSENDALRGDQRDFVNTFQPNRGLSVDTRGTPNATVFA